MGQLKNLKNPKTPKPQNPKRGGGLLLCQKYLIYLGSLFEIRKS